MGLFVNNVNLDGRQVGVRADDGAITAVGPDVTAQDGDEVLLPAPLFLGIWFLFQIVSAAFAEPGQGGVAFWAHVGGFVAGLGMTWWGRRAGWLTPPPRSFPAGWTNRYV